MAKRMICSIVGLFWLATMTLRTEGIEPAVPLQIRNLMDEIFEKRLIPKTIYDLTKLSVRRVPSGFSIPDKTVVPSAPHPLPQPPPSPPPGSVIDVSCVSTGPSCVKSCSGLKNGNYQSCSGCHVFVSCVYGWMIRDRPCPSGLIWDDSKKKCGWSSTTCIDCPPAGRSFNFLVDLREDILGEGDDNIYKWAVKPPASPSNDEQCIRQGTLMVQPPKCVTEIRALLKFKDPKGYSFHASHLVFADGWAGFDGSGHYGMPGMELHTYDQNFYGFLMTQSSSDNVYSGNDTVSDMVSLSARERGFITNFEGVSLTSSAPLRPTSDVFFVGINRVISPLFQDAERSGSGLCSVWISCIC